MEKLLLITVRGCFNPIEFKNHIVYKIQHYNMHMLPAKHTEITGNVEALAEDEIRIRAEALEEDLAFVLEEAKRGPLLAHVEHMSVDWKQASGQYRSFTAKRS